MTRVLHLPDSPCAAVLSFLPTPRVWRESLVRLSKRILLAPQVAARDISVIIDEIFTDMGLLRGPDQRMHLVSIASDPQVWHFKLLL